MSTYYLSVLFLATTAYSCAKLLRRTLDTHKLRAPGPKRRWLIGNLLDMPRMKDLNVFASWQRDYGDIVYLEALGSSVLVLNSAQAIYDLFEKRGPIYSHRPRFVMAGELMGFNQSLTLKNYGPEYKHLRKLTQHVLSPDAVRKYAPIQQQFVAEYMRSLLQDPEKFLENLKFAISRLILAVTYGINITDPLSEYIIEGEAVMALFSDAALPGNYLVDIMPALRYLPPWMPFTGFLRKGKAGEARVYNYIQRPFEHVKNQMASGQAAPSFLSDLLSDTKLMQDSSADYDLESGVKWAAGTLLAAGVETTVATISIFFLLMALHPDVQSKAQAEIDSVIVKGRFISLQDRPRLPYVCALIQELKRWHVVVPLGFARRTSQDDSYRGFHIPANTMVLPNIWGLSQSWSDPGTFNPERFLNNPDAGDPSDYIFGFGRRICPGKHLAENSLFVYVSNILANFTIAPPSPEVKKDHGIPTPQDATFDNGIVSSPNKFQCSIQPRSQDSIGLVDQLCDASRTS